MHPEFGQGDPWHHRRHRERRPRARTMATTAAIVLLAAWAGAATLYPLFRDDALRLLADRQISMRQAYDAQVAQLESEVERLKSMKLLEQERIERTLAELARRQSVLETRQSALTAVAPANTTRDRSPEFTGSLPSPARPTPAGDGKPTPLSDTILIAPPPERWARLQSRTVPPLGPRHSERPAKSALEVRISNLAGEIEALEEAQNHSLNRAEEHYDRLENGMRHVLSDLGLNAARAERSRPAAMGGPFLPFLRAPEDPFARQLGRVRAAAAIVGALKKSIDTVPVGRPAAASEVTSGFGMRIDPFLKQLAMHTGVDFRGEPGDPVRAAAAGKVTQAERNGGYGLMVEIDHGNGIATRYAHLSAVSVAEGASVTAGAVIGRMGTSGRSTGPHLHYEIRVGGEAVDPQRFLRAGLRLEAAR
jgi:murein DD-endopeptidase MepM/ murein hydrolase activator NlpD